MPEIRPLKATDDILAVSSIYEQSWKYAYRGIIPSQYLDSIPSGQWANGLRAPMRFSLLLLGNGELLGTSSYGKARAAEMEGYGEIMSLYLLPKAMHKGYGQMLMQATVAQLKKLGYENIYLWVLEENKNARRFYERFGFIPSGKTRTDTFAGEELQEVQYILDAPSA